ncbi:MAG: hypothetical protein H7039_23785 [Bryobacteraceae bacterium]|nr:hypothetical protein [Bryobacteraceae bacterium]
MLSIQTNVSSMNAQENLRMTNEFQARTISRLTSGYRINQSGDDAAGLAVANKFRSDVAELSQGVRNANDGLSTMQIIDGGLSNISKMLDRLKTLATQSASSSFEGDRATLDREFQQLKTEMDRQASNIGLSNTAGTGNRYNKNLNVYLGGGGDTTTNSGVQVDLSLATDRVTSTALGLTGQTILGGDGTTFSAGNLQTGSVTANQTFNLVVDGTSVTATIIGKSGQSTTDALKQLNDQIGSYGVRASIVNSELTFFSSKSYTVQSTGVASGLVTGTDFKLSADVNNVAFTAANLAGIGTNGAAAGNAKVFTVTFADATTRTINLTNVTSYNTAFTTLSTQLKDNGIDVLKDTAGTGFTFSSATKANFTATYKDDAAAAAAAVGGTYTAAVVSNNTKQAEAALASVTDAVSKLGIVQGKIGTAQNKLTYAIQLAQSQITNFSAAESRIRDADVASEAANLTKAQVLSQASMAALAQANSAPQAVLALLRG